jgi:protein TonB
MTARIIVQFVVEKDGSLTGIKILRDPGYGLGKEAERVLKSVKTKWSPGIQNGKPVRASYNLPITINVKS